MADGEGQETAEALEAHHRRRQPFFAHRPMDEDHVEESQIGVVEYLGACFVPFESCNSTNCKDPQNDQSKWFQVLDLFAVRREIDCPGGHQQPASGVQDGHPVAGTGQDVAELRERDEEVEDLWDEEQQKGLAVVSQNCGDSECHTCKVAVRVPSKDAGRVPGQSRIKIRTTCQLKERTSYV